MIRSRLITFLALGFLTFYGCQDDMQVEKFKRPDWLAGKIFTQIRYQFNEYFLIPLLPPCISYRNS